MTPSELRALLDRRGLHLSRERGQNFLVDPQLAQRLTVHAGVGPTDTVIEIGTGLGALTRALAARARRVLTIEIDSGLIAALREEGNLPDNVELLHADALELDLEACVAAERSPRSPVRVVANLPYSAATPLLRRLLDSSRALEDWSVMVQRELADRLSAAPGTSDYGSFAVLHRLRVDVEKAMELAPGCFFPVPGVRSSFVRIRPRSEPMVTDAEFTRIEPFLRAAFGQRRKTLVNALRGGAWGGAPSRDTVVEALEAMGQPAQVRAERLEPEDFVALFRALV